MTEKFTYYLELSKNPVRFEPVNQLTNVFFDDSNKQVFAVRSGGVMGVVVKGPSEESKSLNFRMDDGGPVISIKISLDQKVLAVQRSTNSVEFMNFKGSNLDNKYSQSCKKNATLLGFVWSYINEVALVTDHGVELYSVIPEKGTLKHLKSISVTVQWFVWCPTNKIALLASSHGSQLLPVIFKPGSVSKMPKVEGDPGRMILERDITLGTLYGTAAVLILRHQNAPQASEVHIHLLNGSSSAPIKRHVLRLGLSGRFAINIVDDLILVHHQASRSSQVFDINLQGENDGTVTYHKAVAPAKSIQPTCLEIPGLLEPQKHACELYSADWVVFQPNIVIDAKLGCLWCIHLILPELCRQIPDLSVCTQLVLNRMNGKEVLLKLLLDRIELPEPPLQQLQSSFDCINILYRKWIESELQIQTASPAGAQLPSKIVFQPRVLITQADMYSRVFQKLDLANKLQKLEWVLISYITSLTQNDIPTELSLNEMLVNTLVKQEKNSALVQFLQYGVVSDSKPLACRLLSLGFIELALDMFARLGATEEIIEILLDQEQVLPALQLAGDKETPRKFLQVAQNTGNATLFHSTVLALRSNPHFKESFLKDERLRVYLNHYASLFPNSVNTSK
ncbi:regulator of MON1-CCZ1 complex [Agrilus planipennis]|uniref:Regulator of MON1-CCZ1 complex n=1 Tax=Agrilus planipennis TaxID=224129 RepID=A0A1W4WFA4_AGRPL|nr:regulator of MON1-CCZ1 complex [Agrilus planipennis]